LRSHYKEYFLMGLPREGEGHKLGNVDHALRRGGVAEDFKRNHEARRAL